MQGILDREFISQIIIILAISLGGWIIFVHPKAVALRETYAVLGTDVSFDSTKSGQAIEGLSIKISSGRKLLDDIEFLNNLADDTTLLYGLISDLGARHDILVKSLNPSSDIRHAESRGFTYTRIEMILEGRYEKIGSFIQAVNELPGFIRPKSLVLKPGISKDGEHTLANFSCDLMHFEIPEVLHGFVGATP